MKSIFPGPPSSIQAWIAPYLTTLNMYELSKHFHVVLGASLFYQFLFIVSPFISKRLFTSYLTLNYPTRIKWDVHFVSIIQSILISCLVLRCYQDDKLKQDRLFGYSAYRAVKDIYSLACGYFLWDTITSFRYISLFGVAFYLHGMAALSVFLFSYKPFLMYYGTAFLAFEFSTPFLNIHWFLDKLQMTGGLCQLINGIVLLVVFFLVRILWGLYAAFNVFSDIYYNLSIVPLYLALIYLTANILLNILNFYWYSKMLSALKKRLKDPKNYIKNI
ncbi:uncharacterized protein T551_03252 [Pneumocystis jirovecii RU7]|uniref:TLC domain-containing protein n=1 Tax=Pneumocystis jirovecii (strain RU7) TaxID=1408657 RepID=A0A0W4ZFZ4_PNEJ7|nr:uncharacterized protein T551_03252 [Pneumocystis jirovecii RU7]KTW27258.1 hypothetical protein T551_03252 [Pneumocystis jirovecii RU7]